MPTSKQDIYDVGYVQSLFDRMSKTYGLVNYISSFGFTERWRKQCVAALDWHADCQTGCDFMSGMGETWELLFAQKNVQLTGLDNSEAMSEQAHKRAATHSNWKVTVLCEDALNSSLQDGSMDFVLSAFGLKTFSDQQLQLLAREISRVLRPGGQVSVVEVSVPPCWLLRLVFMFYLRFLIPVIGKLFAGNSSDYKMLGIYCKAFGNSGKFQSYLEGCGIATSYRSYFYGCASGVVGVKT